MYRRNPETEQDPFLKNILQVVWKRMWIAILMAAVFMGAAVGISLVQAPTYEASAKLLVGQAPAEDRSSSLGSDIQGLQQAAQTVAVGISTKPVAESVVGQLDLGTTPEALLSDLNVNQVQATQFIEVRYVDSDPVRAQEVANTVGDVGAKRISESSTGASGIEASVWEYAAIPEAPVGPEPLRNGVLALGLGLMLGLGLIFLLEYLDDSWRSPEEVEQISGVPNFAVIPKFDVANTKEI